MNACWLYKYSAPSTAGQWYVGGVSSPTERHRCAYRTIIDGRFLFPVNTDGVYTTIIQSTVAIYNGASVERKTDVH